MTGTTVDLVLGLILLGYAITGFRQGFVVSALSLAGFVAGGIAGLWLLPELLQDWVQVDTGSFWRSALLVFGVFVLASLGQGVAAVAGARVRDLVRLRSARLVDAAFGAVLAAAVVSLLLWFLAGAVRGAAPVPLARAVGESRVLEVVDRLVPAETGRYFAGFRSLLDAEGFPRVFSGLQSEPIPSVAPPEDGIAGSSGVARAARSVVKVRGVASSCGRAQEGSGWVVAPERVVTNAHVVAGMRSPVVRVGGTGFPYAARVVLFDPDRDLAVLAVDGLPAPALQQGEPLSRGDQAVVAGFPQDGPYTLAGARVRASVSAEGHDIYGEPGVVRQVYSLYTVVQPGNSGGPLLDPDGNVVGVVFAKSLDDARTGYALTLAEAAPVLRQATAAQRTVSNSRCTAA